MRRFEGKLKMTMLLEKLLGFKSIIARFGKPLKITVLQKDFPFLTNHYAILK